MSQADNSCTEKPCLSLMHDASVCDNHTMSSYTHKVSSFDSSHILSLNSTYDYENSYGKICDDCFEEKKVYYKIQGSSFIVHFV